jgi:short-subunit dehydrogenase
MLKNKPKSILITGASSGLGAALANAYAEPDVFLALLGRNTERLNTVAEKCRNKGAKVTTAIIDVREEKLLRSWIEEQDRNISFDLAIANAGISSAGKKPTEQTDREIFAINLLGMLNTVYPIIDLMKQRCSGQIALMSSLGGFYGLTPAYSSSKAAIMTFGESMRNRLRPFGICVSVICPGYIQTPLTDKNQFKMPFLVPIDKAVKIIQHGLAKNKGLIAFPWQMKLFMWLLRISPAYLAERMAALLRK